MRMVQPMRGGMRERSPGVWEVGFELDEPPWVGGRSPSHEICVSCGLQFGYEDMMARGDREHAFYHGWRTCWLVHGAPWSGHAIKPPEGWDAEEQVRRMLDL